MTTIQASIPDPVLRQAISLAERDRISLEQLISLAVTQAVGVWSQEDAARARASQASEEKFLSALGQVPDVPPAENDRI